MARPPFRFWTFWMIFSILLLFQEFTECKRKPSYEGSNKRQRPHEDSESSEEDTPVSPPQVLGIKGMQSAGIANTGSTQIIPKCLGQDIRMDKLIQVTRFCEDETEEGGKNETTGMMARSLCFTACMYKYLGLIGEDLMFTSNIDSVVIDIFPPVAHIMVKKAMRGCAKQTVLPLSRADNCTSFGPVKGCILRNVNSICSGDYY